MDDDPVPEPHMFVGGAMAFHSKVLAESDTSVPEMDTTVGLVEVDVEARHAVLEGTV